MSNYTAMYDMKSLFMENGTHFFDSGSNRFAVVIYGTLSGLLNR